MTPPTAPQSPINHLMGTAVRHGLERIEQELRHRETILDTVAYASQRFLASSAWELAIGDVLARLGEATGVSRACVFEMRRDGRGEAFASLRHEWTAPGVTSQLGTPELEHVALEEARSGSWAASLEAGEATQGHVRDLAGQAGELLSARGTRSLLDVPVIVAGAWWGFVGCDQCDRERTWTPAEVDALRAAAGILAAAIERTAAEEAFLASEMRYRELVENASDLVCTIDLDAILGFAQLLELDELTQGQRQSVREILVGGRRLLDLVDDLLEIARIEAGRRGERAAPVRADEAVEAALARVRAQASQRAVELIWPGRGAGGRPLAVDRSQLERVLANFLSNAVRFTPDGGTVVVACSDTPNGRIRIAVSDGGTGIEPERLERRFSLFGGRGVEASAVHGMGIGLALAKALAEEMGGTMGVESSVGAGSTFWIELPVASSSHATPGVQRIPTSGSSER